MKKLTLLIVIAVVFAAFAVKASNPYLTDSLKTTAELSAMTPAEGQITVDTTKSTLTVGDGSTAGGKALAREDLSTTTFTAHKVLVTNASGKITPSTVTDTALSFVDATSSIQGQLDDRVSFTDTSHTADTGVVTDGYVIIKLGEMTYKVMTTVGN